MSNNVKNYTEQGGAVTHIGGTLVLDAGGSLDGFPDFTIMSNQAASTAETVAALVTDFNALLTKLKTAGLMTADAE